MGRENPKKGSSAGEPKARGKSRAAVAKIESDRKRKNSSISSADRKPSTTTRDKERDKSHKKKPKMSSANQVRASHILIKHQGSRRKASWKDPEGRVINNTTKDSAISQLKAIREDIVSGKIKFDEVASRVSDCSSAKRGGDLGLALEFYYYYGYLYGYEKYSTGVIGPFGRGQMQKPFEEATYALKVGEISDIVETDSGVHIVMRTG
ncbi:hypothetical protein Patl1_13733 [Pistacia atlantica]|uniref:Uncharacterized protein n=1 Tax=Pistacia atlantica TaxID=434234 RepID=A0ACC1AWI4_9ROSI|nr:hypothetical protein Patl1_13733 [Pistacia atlantica]